MINFKKSIFMNNISNISVEELQAKLNANPHLKVLDVREETEFEEINLNTPLLPLSRIRNMDIEFIEDWKEEEVIVFCKSGVRSLEACLLLKTFGFDHVVNLNGGLKAWLEYYPEKNMK